MGFAECMRKFSQIMLIITNVFVAILGFAVMVIGIWAKVDGKNYVDITDSTSQFTEVSVLLIIVGLFVMLVGAVGVVGGIFASHPFGRITLGVYAVILTLLVICEVAAGIAAAVKKDQLDSLLTESMNTTFKQYYSEDTSKRDAWDTFQSGFKCCGVRQTKDYLYVFGNMTVPSSCCRGDVSTCKTSESLRDFDSEAIYQKGCVTVVVDGFKHNLGAVAGGALALGLIQIIGIVMACFVALYKSDGTAKYEVV